MARTTSAHVLSQKKMLGTSRTKAIRTRLGSARPTFETLIARNEPRWKWPRTTPSGRAIDDRDPERGAREREVLERLVPEQVRVVADEAERVRERPPVEGVGGAITRASTA